MGSLSPFLRRGVLCVLALAALTGAGLAAAGYRIGQPVYWRDDYSAYGGGWVKATIVRDYGSEAVEQYVIKIDGRATEERAARIGMLRPADGTPRPPMPTTDPFRLKQLYGFHPELDSMPLPTDAPHAAGSPATGYEKRGTTLIVLAGESGKNRLVSRDLTGSSDGRDRILIERTDLGLTYRGNRIR